MDKAVGHSVLYHCIKIVMMVNVVLLRDNKKLETDKSEVALQPTDLIQTVPANPDRASLTNRSQKPSNESYSAQSCSTCAVLGGQNSLYFLFFFNDFSNRAKSFGEQCCAPRGRDMRG